MNSVFSTFLKPRILVYFVFQWRQCSHQSIRNILETMTTETPKMSLPKFNKNYAAVEVIGSGAYGAPASVLVAAGNASYLFNCGEGTQRICVEYKKKLVRLPNVFVTYPSWKNCGGLLGMSLSLQSSSLQKFYVHGHPALESLYFATNNFVNLRKMRTKVLECPPGNEFFDGFITIKYVHLTRYPSSDLNKNLSESNLTSSNTLDESRVESTDESSEHDSHESEDDNIDYYAHLRHGNHKHKNKKKRSHSEAPKRRSVLRQDFAISYICRTPKFKGSLLIEKCVDLNVPHGPILGKLKNGEDVVLEDGRLIKSSDVTSPEQPGVVIIVIECPTEEYLDSLLKEPAFYRHQTGEISSEDIASIVVHFTSSEIVKNSKYQEWIHRFPKTTKHLYVNEDNKSLGLSAVYRQQYKLNMLLPDLFPLLKTPSYPPVFPAEIDSTVEACKEISEGHSLVKISNEEDKNVEVMNYEFSTSHQVIEQTYFACNGNNHIKGESLTFLPIVPAKEYDYSYSSTFDKKFFVQEALDSEGFAEGCEKFKNELKALEKVVELKGSEYPKIVFLGTGSSQPNKRRNASGILIFLNPKTVMLMDCGEGTFSQLTRFFGKEKTQEILMNLRVIYISHLHADHHLGLINIVQERAQAFKKVGALRSPQCTSPTHLKVNSILEGSYIKYRKLFVMAPIQIDRWLQIYSRDFEDIKMYIDIIPNSSMVSTGTSDVNVTNLLNSINLKTVKTTLVKHCPNAFGVMLEHQDGWKITYSGDTKPCDGLIEIGKDCDLLIHEATMEDTMAEDAMRKMHSTISQAIEVGKKMNAKFTILTHFSQRYAHIPFFDEKLEENVGVAFDNLMISLFQLPYLAKLNNFLKVLYTEEYERLEEKKKAYETMRKRSYTPIRESSTDNPKKKIKMLLQ